jgi:hypothetical protein
MTMYTRDTAVLLVAKEKRKSSNPKNESRIIYDN